MSLRHSLWCLAAMLGLGHALPGACAPAKTDPGHNSSWPGAELFADGSLQAIAIEIGSAELNKLRVESREFVRATVREGGSNYTDVAIHLKGSVGSFRPLDEKPAFTLDFERFHPGRKFHGLRRIHLNNSVEDPAYCNEQLGGELFRRAGIPAPRATRAVVKLNDRQLGLYVLKEGFTEDFLSCYFQAIGGNLFEPGEGHDVNQRLKRASLPGPTQSRAALKALAEAAREKEPSHRWQLLESSLEVDRFIRFMALEVMLCHRDGYCLARNNFRIYQDIQTGKLVFFPHGMDQLFGIAELPWQPHMAGLVARAILETPEGSERYQIEFKELFSVLFNVQELTNRVEQIVQPMRSQLAGAEFAPLLSAAAELERKIRRRHDYLESQLNASPQHTPHFVQGAAQLSGWVQTDVPAEGRMELSSGPNGLSCLHIAIAGPSFPSWRLKTRLDPGRYRFEGRVRVADVNSLGFGAHQGAGLRLAGEPRYSRYLVGTTDWQALSVEFQVEGAQEIEFICELRAGGGQAWFDCASLKVLQVK